MDPVEDLSKSRASASPVIHYHVYNINQVENVQIGTNNIINRTGYDYEDGDIVDAPPPLEPSTVGSNVQPGIPPDIQPQQQVAGSPSIVTGAVVNTPVIQNITPSNPPSSPPNGASSATTDNGSSAKPQASPPNGSPSTTTNFGSSSKPQASPPNLDPSLHVGKMPFRVRHRLTNMLSVKKPDGKDWRLLVEKLGLEPHYVALWDQRKDNPAEALLQSWAVQSDATVGRLHALLLECDMGDIADIL
ncbi:DAPK1 [Branchiostoma lanceolatum]|uniref:DAPK1 protein n=1 Tax=Branchiostoma lanceolatum TaxID=7740 RepID=A0A8K0A5C7_BRALA|nr:DAPK1 [Branchiostoma lanceolatum]